MGMYPHTSPSIVSGGYFPIMLILGLAQWLVLAAASVANSNSKPSEDLHALLANLGIPDSQQERSIRVAGSPRRMGELWSRPGPNWKLKPSPSQVIGTRARPALPLQHLLVFTMAVTDSVQFSRSVVSDSLRPHESQHTRPPCPSPTPGVHSDSCPSNQ